MVRDDIRLPEMSPIYLSESSRQIVYCGGSYCLLWYYILKMRYALLADIHANLAAFTAVLADIERRGGVEEVWCLGDIVGYGPDPSRCIELLRQHNHVMVSGNHDLAAIGRLDTTNFNPDAAYSCRWTAQQLNPEDINYLENLPSVIEKGDFTLVHGSPRGPIWEYLVSVGGAKENFAYFKSRFCLVGHSHRPLIFKLDESGNCSSARFSPGIRLVLGKCQLIINPGGVGQPRDGDSRASYAIYDSDGAVVKFYRVPYDIKATQERMVRQNLPMRLVVRLQQGV
ncbi:MAG: serine/threonine protein phosphatase [Dehalococcoidales bacterium]|nr:serine/threonine protein phosphatase [Dehalococcoidales bacterium]